MKKTQKNSRAIFAGVLFIIGACAAIIGRNAAVKAGVACLFWGFAIFIIAWIAFDKNKTELTDFDKNAREILGDIATNGAQSEYYQQYNIQIINKLRRKVVRRQRKQEFGIVALGFVLLMAAIVCMI